MERDIQILRELAKVYHEIAQDEHNEKCIRLHKASNGLKMIRPVVLIDELPWSEMNIDGELTLVCQDPFFKEIEEYMRRTIYKFKHLRADMIVRPYLPVQKVIHLSGIGIDVKDEIIVFQEENNIVSHAYEDQLSSEKDLERLHIPEIRYDKEETKRRFESLGEAVGDILPVRKTGIDFMSQHPWDDAARFRGVTNLLMDLAERPEFCHEMIKKLFDIEHAVNKEYLRLGLYDNDPWDLHCTPILCDDLPTGPDRKEVDDFNMIWGRGMAQIFASVSPGMHEEFDIDYMAKTIGQCGLVYYGCCEPLDRKVDIVEKIPNLRKISVTPWADVNVAAEVIGKRYVVASKPNPASVGVPVLDEKELRKELGEILEACKRNGCSCDIVLKDISTCNQNPKNIFEWERIAMEMVQNF